MAAGRFVWRELITPEPQAQTGFYSTLFGWSHKVEDLGFPCVMYQHDTLGEEVGGSMAPPMPGVPAHWLDYITVDDVDASRARVLELGGAAHTDAMDIPGIGPR